MWWVEHDNSACPTVAELLNDGAIERGGSERDPWGGAWRLECDGQDVTVSSNGRDKTPETADDIRVPPPERAAPHAAWRARRGEKRRSFPESRVARFEHDLQFAALS
jgi:hypothetical protein